MARPETPIDPLAGPLAAFAMELRKLREHAGVTYRVLAQRGHCSPSALNEAANGRQLPTWLVTEAFVKGCGADPQQWEARWQAVAAQVKGDSSTAAASRNGGGAVAAPADSSDVGDHLPSGDVPPLSSLTSPQDFHLALRALRVRAGNPSLRELSVLARKHGDHVLPRSTLAGALDRTDRLPSLEIVVAFLSACDVPATEVDAVKAAWTRVAYLLQRDSMPGSTRWQDSCPYLGLAAFHEDQAEVFYGRERMTTELLAQLADRVRGSVGMLVVTGPSGAGKSSLLRAGLLPALAKGALGPGSQDWPHLVIRPGPAPLDELAVHLAQLAGLNSAEVRESLAEHPETAHLNVRQALLGCAAQHAATDPRALPTRLVLIVDQFEELFTVVSDQAERAAFITSLCAMAGVGRSSIELSPAIVVLGLRADSLSDCTTYAPLAEATRSNVFLVGPMTEVELRSAVTGPAAAAGLSIESGLVDNVLAELRSTRTADRFDPGALPLLSQAMLLTWEHREGTTLTHHAYAAGGGLHNGIQKSAEEAYNNLTPAQQEAARRIFLRLVTFTDHGQPTRHPIQLTSLSTDDDTKAALEEFTTKRLITLRKDTAEVVHEVLVHTWQRLGSWIHQDRELLHLFSQLEVAADTWEANKQDPTFLYHGSRLAAVQESLNETGSPVPPSVQSFLDFSKSHERRRTRKLRGLRNLVVLLAFMAFLAGGGTLWQYHDNLALAKSGEYAAKSQLLAPDNPYAAMQLAVKAFNLKHSPVTRGVLLSAQSQYFSGQLTGHSKEINKLVFSPDGNTLASASADGTTRLWNLDSRSEVARLNNTNAVKGGKIPAVKDVEFSPDGHFLVTADDRGIDRLWDVVTHQQIPGDLASDYASDHATDFTAATFRRDRRLLATVNADGPEGTVHLWDVADHHEIAKINSLSSNRVLFSRDGNTLVTSQARNLQLWNVTNPNRPTQLGPSLPLIDNDNHTVNAVVLSPDGDTLAIANSYTVQLWDFHDPGHPIFKRRLTDDTASSTDNKKVINAIMFSPDGKTLATADAGGTARLWDAVTGQRGGILRSSNSGINSVAFHPNGHTVATAGSDSIVRLWETNDRILSAPTVSPNVNYAEFSPDGHTLAIIDGDGATRLWNMKNQRPIATLTNYHSKTRTNSVTFSKDGRLLATTDSDGTAQLWSTANQQPIATLDKTETTGNIKKVVFSPKNYILATTAAGRPDSSGSANNTVQLWNVTDPRHPAPSAPLPLGRTSKAVAFSDDGRLLATIDDADKSAKLWDIANRRLVATLEDRISMIDIVVFSPDGASVVTVSRNGTVQQWEAATGKRIKPRVSPPFFEEHSHPVALSPNGHILATISRNDSTTTLWDIDNDGQPIATLAGHTDHIITATFSQDNRFLATTSGDGTVRLWDLDTDQVTKHLCRIIGTICKNN